MAATTAPATSGTPFPLGKTAAKPWREQALARIGEQRFVLTWLRSQPGMVVSPELAQTLEDHWTAAADAAQGRSRRGAVVERVTSHLDAVDVDLLRLAPDAYVRGQLPGLVAHMKLCLAADDMRRTPIAANEAAPLSECDRDLIVAAQHAVNAEGRRQVSRLRSFKNVLLVTAATLAIGAGGLAVLGIVAPQRLSWAGLLGYSQQLLTRFVDQRAQTVLDNFGRTRAEQQSAHRELDPTPTPT